MTDVTRSHEIRRKRGITVIAGLLIGLGLTAAAAPAVYFAFQENFSQFTEFAALDVQRLNAVRDGDRLVVTGTIKNVGSTSISSIILEELSVDDLRIRQNGALDDGSPKADEYGEMTFEGLTFGGDRCRILTISEESSTGATEGKYVLDAGASGGTAVTPTPMPCNAGTPLGTVRISGLSTINDASPQALDLVRIDGDGSVVLRIEVEGSGSGTVNNFDLTRSVDLTEELSITLRFLSGESAEITEVYRTSVKRG